MKHFLILSVFAASAAFAQEAPPIPLSASFAALAKAFGNPDVQAQIDSFNLGQNFSIESVEVKTGQVTQVKVGNVFGNKACISIVQTSIKNYSVTVGCD